MIVKTISKYINWKELSSVVISALVAVLMYFVTKQENFASRQDAYFGLIIFFSCEIFIRQLFRGGQLRSLNEELRKTSQETARSFRNYEAVMKVSDNLAILAKFDPVIRGAGESAIEDAIKNIRINREEMKLSFIGRDITFKCYLKFWENIAKLQIKGDRNNSLVARMTHTSDISGWMDEYNQHISPQHQKFSKAGGLAFRILIDRNERGASDISDYLDFLNKMKRDGVFAAYINIKNLEGLLPDVYWTADFCVISDVMYTARWKLTPKNKVKGFSLSKSETRYVNHLTEWDDIVDKIRQVDYRSYTKNQSEVTLLNRQREEFLAKLGAIETRQG